MSLTESDFRARYPNASEATVRRCRETGVFADSTAGPVSLPSPAPKRPPNGKETAPKRPPAPKQSESREQQALIKWWDAACEDYELEPFDLMAFPLQGARTARNGARMKAEGMRAGTLDMFLAVPAGDYSGLWIELKAGKGRASPAQKSAIERLNQRGYLAVLCVGREEAQATIEEYLKWMA